MISGTEFNVVLITGALSDIGRAIAMAFAKAGYGAVLNHRRKAEHARAFANTLRHENNAPHVPSIQAYEITHACESTRWSKARGNYRSGITEHFSATGSQRRKLLF
jgi:NAD(P)-dependent dehydrogenase (short-subunit alcohol dehydrogenase family)